MPGITVDWFRPLPSDTLSIINPVLADSLSMSKRLTRRLSSMFTVAMLPSIFVVPLPVITSGVSKAVPAASSFSVK